MHPQDLLNSDLLSRSVLLGAGAVIAAIVLTVVVVVFSHLAMPL
jgi:hypothetical protein